MGFLLTNTFVTIASRTKRALRSIFFRKTREHAIPLFPKVTCLPMSFLFFQHLRYLMYYVHTKKAPINLLNQFLKTITIHNCNTSSTNECFSVKFLRTEKMKKSFTRILFGVPVWNSIPRSMKLLIKSKFLNKIKELNSSMCHNVKMIILNSLN